jgi:hypothetical protein
LRNHSMVTDLQCGVNRNCSARCKQATSLNKKLCCC